MTKPPTSIRLSEEALRLRELLAAKLGISLTAVTEQALRLLARREEIKCRADPTWEAYTESDGGVLVRISPKEL